MVIQEIPLPRRMDEAARYILPSAMRYRKSRGVSSDVNFSGDYILFHQETGH
jgi:hypothetical protein